MRQTGTKIVRNSGVELLKVFAIFLIVLSHVTQTLGSTNSLITFDDYVIHLGKSTLDVQEIILMLFRQSGALGNTIFFVCSAWFLIDKDRYARKKLFYLE